jgi:hypothetical protein
MLVALGAIIFGVAAYLFEGFVQQPLIAIMSAFIAMLLGYAAELSPDFGIPRLTTGMLIALLALTGGTSGYFGWIVWQKDSVARYPIPNGDIANFDGGAGSPARTSMGREFSMFSDNAFNQTSSIYYHREDFLSQPGQGFLRIFYQLRAINGMQPYAGLYADFSDRTESFDVSAFSSIRMRLRLGQLLDQSPIAVEIVLYPKYISGPEYTFPTYELKKHELSTEWTDVKINFSEFRAPSFYLGSYQFNIYKLYRFGINIKGEINGTAHGHIDIDYIRFDH